MAFLIDTLVIVLARIKATLGHNVELWAVPNEDAFDIVIMSVKREDVPKMLDRLASVGQDKPSPAPSGRFANLEFDP